LNPALNLGFGPCRLYDATIAPNMITRCAPPPRTAISAVCSRIQSRPGARYITQYTDVGVSALTTAAAQHALDVGTNVNINANYTVSNCEALSPLAACSTSAANHVHQPYQNNRPTDRKSMKDRARRSAAPVQSDLGAALA